MLRTKDDSLFEPPIKHLECSVSHVGSSLDILEESVCVFVVGLWRDKIFNT